VRRLYKSFGVKGLSGTGSVVTNLEKMGANSQFHALTALPLVNALLNHITENLIFSLVRNLTPPSFASLVPTIVTKQTELHRTLRR
jgi:hypothetical protein